MTLKNTPDHWGGISQLLHWLIVLLLLAIAGIGLTMGDLPNGPRKINIYALHKSLGLTLLALVMLRVAWRLYAGAPRAVPGTPAWQHHIASLTHILLYLLMFALPISGWVLNSSAGYPLQWFKQFNLPALSAPDPSLHSLAQTMHTAMFWVLVSVIVLHAGAAFYHHLFQHDDTLRRMLPGRRRST